MDFRGVVQQLGLSVEQTSLAKNAALNPEVRGVCSIDQTCPGTLSFLEHSALAYWIPKVQVCALILPNQPDLLETALAHNIAWIATDHPRLLFARTLELFYQPWRPDVTIHPTAVIDPSVKMGKNIAIGAYVTIQADVILGDGVCLYPQVTLYPQVEIGDRSVLHANCVIQERSIIGQDCMIHSGAVIGSEGFGFVPTATGLVKMPQSGRVVLEDGVEIGCNTTIDRPAVGETRIGQGTKIDNLVQVGHGCQIGRNCILVSQVGLAGAAQLGDRVILAGQVGVSEKIKIGTGAIATAKAGIIQDVNAGETVSGHPAMPHKLWLRISLLLRRLPQWFKAKNQD